MIFYYFLLAWFFVTPLFAALTKTSPPLSVEKTAEIIDQATSTTDIGKINARLRVEGASFRPFNLYLSKTTPASPLAQKWADELHQIVVRDLTIVRGFNFLTHQGAAEEVLLKQKGAEGLSKIEVNFVAPNIKATIEHKNLITGKRGLKTFLVHEKEHRKLAHLLAQSIYEEFIGPEKLFLSQIFAVKRESTGSQIVMLDFDGKNETVITSGPWRKTAPSLAPDQKSLLYTVIMPHGQGIVEQDIASKRMQFRTKKPGINLDAKVLADNSGMLVTLSFENNYNIYLTTRAGEVVRKLTNSLGMSFSPTLSPDKTKFAFVSDRSGTPQIYMQPLSADPLAKAVRLTHQGKNNTTPVFSPKGTYIAFTGRDEKNVFDIFLLEVATGRISRMTENQGRNQEPVITDSERFALFVSERGAKPKSDIYLGSLNGDHQIKLTDADLDNKTLGYFSPIIRSSLIQ